MTTTKKKEPMIHLGLRIPRSIFNRLARRARREGARSATVNVSAIVRAILQEHA